MGMVAASSLPLRNMATSDYGDWNLCKEVRLNSVTPKYKDGISKYCTVSKNYYSASALCAPVSCDVSTIHASAKFGFFGCMNHTAYFPHEKHPCEPALAAWMDMLDVRGGYSAQCHVGEGWEMGSGGYITLGFMLLMFVVSLVGYLCLFSFTYGEREGCEEDVSPSNQPEMNVYTLLREAKPTTGMKIAEVCRLDM